MYSYKWESDSDHSFRLFVSYNGTWKYIGKLYATTMTNQLDLFVRLKITFVTIRHERVNIPVSNALVLGMQKAAINSLNRIGLMKILRDAPD